MFAGPWFNTTAHGGDVDDAWELCDGSLISIAAHQELYDIIGIKYGAAAAAGFFHLPDIRGFYLLGGTNTTVSTVTGTTSSTGATSSVTTTIVASASATTLTAVGGTNASQTDHTHTGATHTHTAPNVTMSFIIKVE